MAKSSTIEPDESSWAGGPTCSGLAVKNLAEVSEKMNEHLGVSINGGTPKLMIYKGKSY
jgi:hypothetical protein